MDLLTDSVDHGDFTLYVHQAVDEYLGEINPTVEWTKRGFKASDYRLSDSRSYQEQLRDRIDELRDFDEHTERRDEFIEESLDVFDFLVDRNVEAIRESFDADSIYFITGPPRTGGTYLLKALFDLRGDSVTDCNFKFVHDYLPSKQMKTTRGNLAPQVIFEWAQWIVWTRRELDNEEGDYIPKKYMRASFQLDMLDRIFGNMAHFVITSRHPGEAYQSYADRFLPKDENLHEDISIDPWKNTVLPRTNLTEENWERLTPPDQFLLYWCSFYLEILNWSKTKSLTPLRFGQSYEKFLQQFARGQDQIYLPEKFEPSDRTNLPSFSPQCNQIRNQVEEQWEEVWGQPLY